MSIVLLLSLLASPQAEPMPPNFVVIFCDDLGYGDLGCFGSEKHRTPNLDEMAQEGMRLTSFYSTSGVCTPSRSSLLTGCYPRRVNMHQDDNNNWVLFPVASRGLNPEEVTIAEILRDHDYATTCIGKWHLGDQECFLPTKQGFTESFGIPYSNDMLKGRKGFPRTPPLPLYRNDQVIEAPVDQTTITKRYTEEAVAFIKRHRDRPFFLYLPHTMPHNPVHSSEAFAGKSANSGYGDCVEEIDWSTGKILDALKNLDLAPRTLVLFLSDNGAAKAWGGGNGPLSGFKGSTMEGGMRVPCLAWWPGTIEAGTVCDELASTLDVLPTLSSLAGATRSEERVIDGLDIGGLLRGKVEQSPREHFFYYRLGHLQAVRWGDWKLHFARKKREAMLFHLGEDRAEKNNVIEEHPEVVEKINQLAEVARAELGDKGRQGTGQRPPGRVEEPVPLVRKGE